MSACNNKEKRNSKLNNRLPKKFSVHKLHLYEFKFFFFPKCDKIRLACVFSLFFLSCSLNCKIIQCLLGSSASDPLNLTHLTFNKCRFIIEGLQKSLEPTDPSFVTL